MILDGDILNYFESIAVDVKYEEGEESSFTFLVSYREFDMDCRLELNHKDSSVTFVLEFLNPKSYDSIPQALNTVCLHTPFKAYYDRIKDIVYVKGFSFVTEENIISTIEFFIDSLVHEDYQYIENLYNYIYKEDYSSVDDDELEASDETSIEEDLAELMRLLNKV